MNYKYLDAKYAVIAEKVGLQESDVEEKFVRGGGAGGQKVNKTSSTVLLFHKPSGISVRCQKNREQTMNRWEAWKILTLKLEEKIAGKKSKIAQKNFKLKKQKQRRKRKTQLRLVEDKRAKGEIKKNRQKIVSKSE